MQPLRKSFKAPKGRRSIRDFDSNSRTSTPDRYAKNPVIRPPPVYNHYQFDPKEFMVAESSEHEIEVLKQIFDFLDTDKDGMLTPMDIRKAMIQYGGYQPKRNFVYQMMAPFDKNESGSIEFKQFVQMMTDKPTPKDTVDDIQSVFKQIDQNNKGYISVEDLKEIAEELQQTINEQELKEIMKKCDPKNDGTKITWEAFYAFNKQKQF